MNESRFKTYGNIVIALILSAAVIISCFIGVKGLAEFKRKKYNINIKGYTKEQILSDWIVWSGYYDVQAENLKDGCSHTGCNEKSRLNCC